MVPMNPVEVVVLGTKKKNGTVLSYILTRPLVKASTGVLTPPARACATTRGLYATKWIVPEVQVALKVID